MGCGRSSRKSGKVNRLSSVFFLSSRLMLIFSEYCDAGMKTFLFTPRIMYRLCVVFMSCFNALSLYCSRGCKNAKTVKNIQQQKTKEDDQQESQTRTPRGRPNLTI
jgi:hypothetical protein